MSKGSAYLNIWMEVIRHLNEAVVDCRSGVQDAVSAVDKAVAYYAGSRTIEGNSEGVLLYALAETLALQMNNMGFALVNVDIFREFKSIQANLLANETALCDQVERSKEYIVTMMMVPMIQSIMRSAYMQGTEPPTEQEDSEKIDAEGATFASTMLPFIHSCESRAAEIIHSHMKLGVIANFSEVQEVLESTYTCLNITSEQVGIVANMTPTTSSGWIFSKGSIWVTIVMSVLITGSF